MHPRGPAKLVAAVLAVGMIVTFAATYLVQAGFSFWTAAVAALLLVGVPVALLARSSSDQGY